MSQEPAKQKIVDACLRVPCTQRNFIRAWMKFLRPIHKLTDKETDVAAQFVEQWMKLSTEVKDEAHLNKLLFSKEIKDQICDNLGLKQPYFRTILQRLRRNGIIEGNKLSKMYIPSYVPGKKFRLMVIFDDAALSGEHNK